MSGSFRRLIRNLRKGNHLKLKIMQPPVELEAIAALLREAGVHFIQVCPPGTKELPLAKNNHWRLSCHLKDKRHFEIATFNGKLYIKKVIELIGGMPPRDDRPWLGYTGPTDSTNNYLEVDLADPDFPAKAFALMDGWQNNRTIRQW